MRRLFIVEPIDVDPVLVGRWANIDELLGDLDDNGSGVYGGLEFDAEGRVFFLYSYDGIGWEREDDIGKLDQAASGVWKQNDRNGTYAVDLNSEMTWVLVSETPSQTFYYRSIP